MTRREGEELCDKKDASLNQHRYSVQATKWEIFRECKLMEWMLTWKFWVGICATGILRDKLCFWDPTYSEISKFCHNSVFFRHVHVKPCAKSAARNNFEWILIQRPALAGRLSQCRTVTRVLQLNMMLQAQSSNQGGDYNCREKKKSG